jgi:hypothetical protein
MKIAKSMKIVLIVLHLGQIYISSGSKHSPAIQEVNQFYPEEFPEENEEELNNKKPVLDDKKKSTDGEEAKQHNSVVAYAIYVMLVLSGLYLTFFGFRIFRLMMTILGFQVSYYSLLFVLAEIGFYKYKDIGHQISLFFVSAFFGLIIAIICYLKDRLNFVIFGCAIATAISLIYAQFFTNFDTQQEKLILAGIYGTVAVTFAILSFYFLEYLMIWGSAFTGSIITLINIGIVFGKLILFEKNTPRPANISKDLMINSLLAGLLLISGILTQYYLRSRIMSRLKETNLGELRATSFLE